MRSASLNQIRSARRLLRAKERREQRRFLVEGPQGVREALAVPETVHAVFCTAAAAARHPELTREAWQVDDDQLAELTDTISPQGLVAVCGLVDRPLPEVLAEAVSGVPAGRPRLIACCAEIRDPGNAGTVIRCADAAGADAVVFGRDSVDVYNPKVVRATAGSLFHLPVVVGADLPRALDQLRSAGLRIRAASGDGTVDLAELDASGRLAEPTGWLFGNEARGLAADQAALADETVAIPVFGRAESLNLSTAAAVCLYASAFAQRR